MPVDTRIEGDPESIRSAAHWLRRDLAASIHGSVTRVYLARDHSDSVWQGSAATEFRDRMTTGGRKADQLAAAADQAGRDFEVYADQLRTAQVGMARARQIASDAGLRVVGDVIAEPEPTPGPSGDQAGAVQQAHERQVHAYAEAAGEASRAVGILETAKATFRNAVNDLLDSWPLVVADFVNGGVAAALLKKHQSILVQHSDSLRAESKAAAQRYLKTRGGSAESRYWNRMALTKYLEGDEWSRRAESAGRRVGSKIPIVGLGITAAGIGYDIHQGKPAGKAIISGIGGAGGAALAGATVGTLVGGPVVGTLVGAGVGVLAGVVVGAGLDYGYDQLPQGVKDSIDHGIDTVGHAAGDAGEAVGGGVKRVWHSIF